MSKPGKQTLLFSAFELITSATTVHDFIHTGIMNYCNLVEKVKEVKKRGWESGGEVSAELQLIIVFIDCG